MYNTDKAKVVAHYENLVSLFALDKGDPEEIAHQFGWVEPGELSAFRDIGGNRTLVACFGSFNEGEYAASLYVYTADGMEMISSYGRPICGAMLSIEIDVEC